MLQDAKIDFEFDYGSGDRVFQIVERKITFADYPVEPDRRTSRLGVVLVALSFYIEIVAFR